MPSTYDSLEQPLVVGKDFEIDVAVRTARSATPDYKPATALTLTAFVAQTATGASAAAATVAELASAPGTYRISVDGAAITAGALGTESDPSAAVGSRNEKYLVLKQSTKVLKVWQVYFFLSDRIG